MTKGFRYWFRCTTVATLSALITFNPAWAGRGIRALLGKRAAAVCCEPSCATPVVCSPPAASDCCDSGCAPVLPTINTGCCDVGLDCAPAIPYAPAQSIPLDMLAPQIPPAPMDMGAPLNMGDPMDTESAVPMEPTPPTTNEIQPATPAAPSVIEKNAEESPSDTPEKMPAAPNQELPATPADPSGSGETAPATPPADIPFGNATEPAPSDNLFGEPEMKPVDPAPAAADPFGAPAEPALTDPAPAAPAGNDLFGTPPAEPMPAAPAGDDLFGTPPAEPMPAAPAGDDPFGAPALPANDNLFGEPPAAAPADNLFDTPATDAAPSNDNLFGEPEPASPAPPSNVDDLFGTPASLEPSEPGADVIGQPTSVEATGNDLNDLFGTPAIPEQEQPAVSSEPAPEVDFFKSTRTWHDNTGLFQIDAKLVAIFSDSVRLIKENGKFCTLPVRRLSEDDKRFVEHVAQLLPGSDAKYVSTEK